jgi:hypothetical protein
MEPVRKLTVAGQPASRRRNRRSAAKRRLSLIAEVLRRVSGTLGTTAARAVALGLASAVASGSSGRTAQFESSAASLPAERHDALPQSAGQRELQRPTYQCFDQALKRPRRVIVVVKQENVGR